MFGYLSTIFEFIDCKHNSAHNTRWMENQQNRIEWNSIRHMHTWIYAGQKKLAKKNNELKITARMELRTWARTRRQP